MRGGVWVAHCLRRSGSGCSLTAPMAGIEWKEADIGRALRVRRRGGKGWHHGVPARGRTGSPTCASKDVALDGDATANAPLAVYFREGSQVPSWW